MKKRRKKIKQKGGFFMLPFIYAAKKFDKLTGRGVRGNYKKNRKIKKQKDGFLLSFDEIWG